MDWTELLQAALVLVVRFLAVWFLALINVEIDEALLNTIVAAIVAWLLALFGIGLARKARVPGIRAER